MAGAPGIPATEESLSLKWNRRTPCEPEKSSNKGEPMSDYVKPAEVVSEALAAAERKAALPVRDMLVRGILAGAFLGYATSLVFVVLSQGVAPIVGAILFPVGFVMLVL